MLQKQHASQSPGAFEKISIKENTILLSTASESEHGDTEHPCASWASCADFILYNKGHNRNDKTISN
jgi:hypothetical protein